MYQGITYPRRNRGFATRNEMDARPESAHGIVNRRTTYWKCRAHGCPEAQTCWLRLANLHQEQGRVESANERQSSSLEPSNSSITQQSHEDISARLPSLWEVLDIPGNLRLDRSPIFPFPNDKMIGLEFFELVGRLRRVHDCMNN